MSIGLSAKCFAASFGTIVGHESVETTLNVSAHSSEQMKRDAAKKIDEAIGTVLGADVSDSDTSYDNENGSAEEPADGADQPKATVFEPYRGKRRKSGTGYVKQLSVNCWQGRYSPTINGKRIARNVYAPTEEECEVKLADLIMEMKAEFGIR